MAKEEQNEDNTALEDVVSQFEDAESFAKALKNVNQDYYQRIYSLGYGTAKGEFETEITNLEGKVSEYQEQLNSYDGTEDELKQTIQKQRQEIQDLKNQNSELEQSADQTIREFKRDNLMKDVLNKASQSVKYDYAEFLADREELDERIDFDDEGELIVRDEHGAPIKGADPVEVLSNHVVENTPRDFHKNKAGSTGLADTSPTVSTKVDTSDFQSGNIDADTFEAIASNEAEVQ